MLRMYSFSAANGSYVMCSSQIDYVGCLVEVIVESSSACQKNLAAATSSLNSDRLSLFSSINKQTHCAAETNGRCWYIRLFT